MGASTTASTEQARAALAAVRTPDRALGDELLSAATAIAGSHQLMQTVTDVGIDAEVRTGLVRRIFARSLGEGAIRLLTGMAAARWSAGDDLVGAIEDIAFRAYARTASSTAIESELFAVQRAIGSDSRLELALSNTASPVSARLSAVDRLVVNATAETRAIVRHVVSYPRGRRIVEGLERAERIVADAKGGLVATVQVAHPLGAAQLRRLGSGLESRYGRSVVVDQVIDPTVVGGVRIAIGDDVIDGTVRARLDGLRLQLA